jgi:hypothetical protein
VGPDVNTSAGVFAASRAAARRDRARTRGGSYTAKTSISAHEEVDGIPSRDPHSHAVVASGSPYGGSPWMSAPGEN